MTREPNKKAYDELFRAVECGMLGKVNILLRRYVGFEVNQRNTEGLSLLHLAVQHGHGDLATFLLRKGTNVNITDVRER